MEQTPKDYSRQIEQINAALTKERASVDTLRNELGAAKTKIDELNHSVYKWWTTANQLEHTLAAVYKSGSWRVTWPLRKLMYYVKRLFPHFSGLKERPAHVGNTSRDFPSTLHKRLFVDISELSRHDAGTGVQRVVRSMLGELLKNPPTGYQVEPVYATAGSKGYYYAGKYISRLLGHHDTTVSDEPLCPRRGDVFLGLDLQHHVAIAQADYFKRLKCLNIPVYFVVYDMLPITFPQYFAKGLADLHAQWLGVISQSDGLICISETVAFEVMEWLDKHYPARKATLKITYNHIGAGIENYEIHEGLPEDAEWILSHMRDSYTFLMVGTIEPRKGHRQVLSAFEELWARGIEANLVIVGRHAWMTEDLVKKIQEHPHLGRRLFYLIGISDEYLEKIYSASTCLILASEGEGFGLPLIEAAQFKLPVIARDIAVFREVAGVNAYYFNTMRAKGLADAIEQWILLYKEDKHPKSDNMSWVSWEQSAKNLTDIILTGLNREPFKQLMIDISELVRRDAETGIQRVVRSLLKELLTSPPEDMLVEAVYATPEQGYRYARRFTAGFIGSFDDTARDEPVEYQAGDSFLGLDLQPEVVLAQRDFYRRLRLDGVNVQFLVYDLCPIRYPQWFIPGLAAAFTRWLEVITQADGAICISKATADDLRAWMAERKIIDKRPFRISVSHVGVDFAQSTSLGMPNEAERILALLCKRPSFLMVGTLEPRKGHTQTLAAFEQLWAEGIDVNLVIVGKLGWMAEALAEKLRRHSEYDNRLFWLEGISDEYLGKIYLASTCLIAASEAEGFGLPLIEAAQHKLPVIARDIAVYREVAGEFAFYFKGKQPSDIAASVKDWLALYLAGEHPRSDNMPWITWKECAKVMVSNLLNPDIL